MTKQDSLMGIQSFEELYVSDLESFLHAFRTFDWSPRVSLPNTKTLTGNIALCFSTESGNVVLLKKESNERYNLKFGFEDPDHPDKRVNVKLDRAKASEVEESIKVFFNDSLEEMRAFSKDLQAI